MAESPTHDALRRILKRPANQTAFDALATLPGADFTSRLMAVSARRAESVTPSDLMRQRDTDRFVAPSPVDAVQIARLELLALEVAAKRFGPLALAPMAPFGAHQAMGATPQNNVVTTARLAEVTADPTNSLALEAASRRRELLRADPRSNEAVRLAAVHRVTRAQHFAGPRSFAHFSQLGMVTAARDRGNHRFEFEALVEHAHTLAAIAQAAASKVIEIKLTAFNDDLLGPCRDLCEQLSTEVVRWSLDQERTHGRGYYRNICFKLHASINTELVEVGDGGDVSWTQDLVQSRKERFMTSGLGVERLEMVIGDLP